MAKIDGQIVQLMMVSSDDALADAFTNELANEGTVNPVLRFREYHESIEYLESLPRIASEQASHIIILDLRESPRDAVRFLNELHRRRPFTEPIVFVIGSQDTEPEGISAHKRYIAGWLPEDSPGAVFIEQAADTLSANWTFEKSSQS